MPALKAIFTADATQLLQTLKGIPPATAQAMRGMRREMMRAESQRLMDSANPFSQNFGGRAAGAGVKGGGILAGLSNRFLGVGAAISGAYGAVRLVGETIKTDIAYQRVRNTLESVTKSAEKAGEEFDFLRKESDRVGFSFLGVADDFARFKVAGEAAGLTAAQTRKIFTSLQEAAAVMGLSTERTSEAMLALEQMLGKGTVMSQELRIQLGNALPGANAIFARALGVSQQELYKMVEAGTLLSKNVLPQFADELKRTFTLTDEANKTARDINRLTNAWTELKAELGKDLRTPANKVLAAITAAVSGARVMASGEFSEGPVAALIPGLHKLQMEDSEGKAGVAMMEKRAADAKELHDRLKAITQLHALNRVLKLDPKEEKRLLEESARVNEEAASREERNRFNTMTPGEKRAELQKQRAEHQKSMAALEKMGGANPGATTLLNVALHRKAIAEIEDQISDLDEKRGKHERRGSGLAGNLSEWERAGGFMAGPQVDLLNVNRAQLDVLKKIHASQGKSHPTFSPRRQVRF